MQRGPHRPTVGCVTAPTRLYVAECYSPAVDREAVEAAANRARAAAAELQRRGRPIEYVAGLLMPTDEAVFHLFAAGSPEAVREASLRAEIEFARALESLVIGDDAFAGIAGHASGSSVARRSPRRGG